MYKHTKKVVMAVVSIFTAFNAAAHDFWLVPSNFKLAQPAGVSVKFQVGHKEEAESWGLQWQRIVALRNYHQSGVQDMSATIIPYTGMSPGLASVDLQTAGTHIIGFESYHSFSELAPEKFNDYAEQEGLALVLAHRTRAGTANSPGREIYSRKAKAIIQVGESLTENTTKAIGHTLEIVPQQHPHAGMTAEGFKVKVLFKGRPLENALIELISLSDAKFAPQALRTNGGGEASFSFSATGNYMFNVIWAVPLTGRSDAEFETYFSSLTLGY
jgi:uncharacterized GH25 family protein